MASTISSKMITHYFRPALMAFSCCLFSNVSSNPTYINFSAGMKMPSSSKVENQDPELEDKFPSLKIKGCYFVDDDIEAGKQFNPVNSSEAIQYIFPIERSNRIVTLQDYFANGVLPIRNFEKFFLKQKTYYDVTKIDVGATVSAIATISPAPQYMQAIYLGPKKAVFKSSSLAVNVACKNPSKKISTVQQVVDEECANRFRSSIMSYNTASTPELERNQAVLKWAENINGIFKSHTTAHLSTANNSASVADSPEDLHEGKEESAEPEHEETVENKRKENPEPEISPIYDSGYTSDNSNGGESEKAIPTTKTEGITTTTEQMTLPPKAENFVQVMNATFNELFPEDDEDEDFMLESPIAIEEPTAPQAYAEENTKPLNADNDTIRAYIDELFGDEDEDEFMVQTPLAIEPAATTAGQVDEMSVSNIHARLQELVRSIGIEEKPVVCNATTTCTCVLHKTQAEAIEARYEESYGGNKDSESFCNNTTCSPDCSLTETTHTTPTEQTNTDNHNPYPPEIPCSSYYKPDHGPYALSPYVRTWKSLKRGPAEMTRYWSLNYYHEDESYFSTVELDPGLEHVHRESTGIVPSWPKPKAPFTKHMYWRHGGSSLRWTLEEWEKWHEEPELEEEFEENFAEEMEEEVEEEGEESEMDEILGTARDE